MCSSGLRYCQFLVKVFSSSSSSGTRRGDQTDDHTGNDARKPDVTPQVSGLFVFAVFFFLFSFCRFVVTYVLGPWKSSQMNDARYRRCLNHNIYYMRDITAIYTIRYIKKKKNHHHADLSASALVFSCTYQKQKHISCNIKWDEVCRYHFNWFYFQLLAVSSRLKWGKLFLNEGPAFLP